MISCQLIPATIAPKKNPARFDKERFYRASVSATVHYVSNCRIAALAFDSDTCFCGGDGAVAFFIAVGAVVFSSPHGTGRGKAEHPAAKAD